MDKLRSFLAAPFYLLAFFMFALCMVVVVPMLMLSVLIAHGPAKIKSAWIKAGEEVDERWGK